MLNAIDLAATVFGQVFKRRSTLAVAAAVAGLALTSTAKADYFTGTFGFTPGLGDPGGTATYDGSSLTLNGLNTVIVDNGSFANESLATVTAYTGTVSGLSATQTPVSIPGYLLFATPSQLTGLGGNGDIYRFDLTSLSETTPGGFGNFYATGTLVDTSGVLSPTPAIATFGFTGSGNNYTGSVSAQAVPEPATVSIAAALVGSLAIRRRKSAR